MIRNLSVGAAGPGGHAQGSWTNWQPCAWCRPRPISTARRTNAACHQVQRARPRGWLLFARKPRRHRTNQQPCARAIAPDALAL